VAMFRRYRKLPRLARRSNRTSRQLVIDILEDRRMLATLLVDTLSDSVVHSGNSLRDQLDQANFDSKNGQPDTIKFAPALSGQTIRLLQGALQIGKTGAGSGVITIDGGGTITLTVDATNPDNVIQVVDGAKGALIGLTITGGSRATSGTNCGVYNDGTLAVSQCQISNNVGSGIYNTSHNAFTNGGDLTISDSTISVNTGTGIVNNFQCIMSMTDCFVLQNAGSDNGGGIYNNSGTLTITGSTISGNTSSSLGGGIFNYGLLYVSGSVISNNTAALKGGGICGGQGGGGLNVRLRLINSTISGNHVTGDSTVGGKGGGLYVSGSGSLGTGVATVIGTAFIDNIANTVNSTGYGGAIDCTTGILTVANSTFSGNSAYYGGAINIESTGSSIIENSTLSGNNATYGGGIYNNSGTGTLINTIVAENTASISFVDAKGTLGGSGNLVGIGTGLTGITNGNNLNQIGTVAAPIDPLLGPLGDNGGVRQTFALLTGSPAINAGGAITNTVTAIDASVVNFDVALPRTIAVTEGSYVIAVDDEVMLVTNINNNTLTVQRGYNGTTAVAHAAGAGVFLPYDQTGQLRGGNVDIGAFEVAQIFAPQLNPAKSPQMLEVGQHGPAPAGAIGTLVSTLVDFGGTLANVVDTDRGALAGIAISTIDETQGTWWYSLDNGASWTKVGAVSDQSALLLAANAKSRLYFQPNGTFLGTLAAGLTMHAWDQSAGVNGGHFDASVNGGSTSISTQTDIVSQAVIKLNTAPVLDSTKSPALVKVLEDAAAPVGKVGTLIDGLVHLTGSLKNVSDPDAGALTGIAVTATSTLGTWYYSVNDGASWTLLGSVSETNARLLAADGLTRLYFKPIANLNGTLNGVFAFRAWDRTAGTTNGSLVSTQVNGGISPYSNSSDTAAITVTAVNDAPVLDPAYAAAFLATNEDVGEPFGGIGTKVSDLVHASGSLKNVSDVDAGAQIGIAIIGAESVKGSWRYSIDNGVTWKPLGAVGPTNARLLYADNATRLFFKPNANFSGDLPTAVTFRAWDRTVGVNGGTANITAVGGISAFSSLADVASQKIIAVNDAPTLDTTKSPTLNQVARNAAAPVGRVGTLIDALIHLTGSLKNMSDVDATQIGIAVTKLDTTKGSWYYSTNNGTTWAVLASPSTTAAKLFAADGKTRLYFKPNANFVGTIDSAVTFRAWDRSSGANLGTMNVATWAATSPFSKLGDTASIKVT
jgi:hypothetical protein